MSLSKHMLGLVVTLFVLSVLFGSVQGEMVDDKLEVEYYPDPVVIGPGEEATVTITVTSHSDESMEVAFEFVPVDAPRHSEGYFTTVLTRLGPGAEKTNELLVRSNAQRSDDEAISDFVVVVSWGRDIKMDRENNLLASSVDGSWQHEFSVLFVPEPELGYLPIAIVMGLVVVVAVILFYPALPKRLLKW